MYDTVTPASPAASFFSVVMIALFYCRLEDLTGDVMLLVSKTEVASLRSPIKDNDGCVIIAAQSKLDSVVHQIGCSDFF